VLPNAEGSAGNYGGIVRRGFKGVSDRWGPTKMQDRGLGWYDQDLNVQPRLAESWSINEDASEWTFNLREGAKWSDGAPFDASSFQWWYENDLQNTDINPGINPRWMSGGVVMGVESVDDYTVKYSFQEPKPLFIYETLRTTRRIYLPGHYLNQFHWELTEDQDKLQADTEAAGFNAWNEYYEDRRWWYLNQELPSMGPWVADNELSSELFVMKRNPYFPLVDQDGQQLPYVDQVNHRLFETNDVFDLRIIAGEIDFQGRHVALDSFTLYKENEEAGDYSVYLGFASGHTAIQLNQTTKEPRLRELFQNTDVRKALSVAVDRVTLNELVFDGLLTPRQYSPLSSSPQSNPEQASAYTDYDTDMANQLLDGAGYSDKNAGGQRLWPGSDDPISFIVEGTAAPGTQGEDAALQIVKYFADVGITATYQYFERSLYTEHFRANEIEAAFWGGDRTVLPIVAPWIFEGTMIDRPWGVAWGLHRSTGGVDPNSEEPPEGHWIWDIWELQDQIAVEPSDDRRNELFQQVLAIWAEELPMIGYLGESPSLVIVKNGFVGYKAGFPLDDTTGDEHLLHTETYYWENPAEHGA
jgi:peptide/nickel transport system substrate-binding protein